MDNSIEKKINDLITDDNFIKLKEMYESPNSISVMGQSRREEWHSNFVNWFLDPKSNHGLDEYPMKCFLDLVKTKTEGISIGENDLKLDL